MRHLAEINIGRLRGGQGDPRMADFYNNLARVNALAERMPGFVWRLKNETGESAIGLHWPGDPTMQVNLTLWENEESLGKFVFETIHRNIYITADDRPELRRRTRDWLDRCRAQGRRAEEVACHARLAVAVEGIVG